MYCPAVKVVPELFVGVIVYMSYSVVDELALVLPVAGFKTTCSFKKDFEEVRRIAAEKLNVVNAQQNSGSRIDNSRIQQSRLLMENEGN